MKDARALSSLTALASLIVGGDIEDIDRSTCTRPSAFGGTCKNDAVAGKLFCKGHMCPAHGCAAGKSGREAACPAHTTVGAVLQTGERKKKEMEMEMELEIEIEMETKVSRRAVK